MATETLRLRTRDGREITGRAEVARVGASARLVRGGGLALGGLLLGGASIFVPGVHLISTWLIPLLAFGVAAYVVRIRARVGVVELTCPACGAEGRTEPVGALADEAVWIRCPSCAVPLELLLGDPEGPAAG